MWDDLTPAEQAETEKRWRREDFWRAAKNCATAAGRVLMTIGMIAGCLAFVLLVVAGAEYENRRVAAPCEALGGHYQHAGLGYPATCWAPDGVTRLFPED